MDDDFARAAAARDPAEIMIGVFLGEAVVGDERA
jgi:hypothetical protein